MSPKPPRPAAKTPPRPPQPPNKPPAKTPFSAKVRELADELVFVFVIVMFMKMFLVELYKIPTGSMTPTLLGGMVAHVDANGDGLEDLVYVEEGRTVEVNRIPEPQILPFINDGKRLKLDLSVVRSFTPATIPAWFQQGILQGFFDRILVNKFAYWFRTPKRGEVVVFKVPEATFTREAPIYIKRMVGEPGDKVSFVPDETPDRLDRLVIDGEIVEQPEFFREWRYRSAIELPDLPQWRFPWITYERDLESPNVLHLREVRVPDDAAWVLGDNTEGSLDSRYWGGVPLNNFKGRAFMRVWPLRRFGTIE